VKHARFYYINGLGQFSQALGSDSIVIFNDAACALTPRGMHNVTVAQAEKLNRKDGLNKGYVGYAIFTGKSILHSYPEKRKLYPTSVEYVALCEKATPALDYLWR